MIALVAAAALAADAAEMPAPQKTLEGNWRLSEESCGLSTNDAIAHFDHLEVQFQDGNLLLTGSSSGCQYSASGRYNLNNGELLWVVEEAHNCSGVSVANSEVRKISFNRDNQISILGRPYFNERCPGGIVTSTWNRI